MAARPPVAGYDLPELPADDRLRKILARVLERDGGALPAPTRNDGIYWDAGFFGLDRCGLYAELDEEARAKVLAGLATGLIDEALAIERAGIGHMGRMLGLAESVEERALYGAFTGQEANHLLRIQRFRVGPPAGDPGQDAFLALLGELVESEDKTLLLFMVQVVLEGWGLTHYRALASGCREPALASTLDALLVDEAAHHAAGITLFERQAMEPASAEAIAEVLARFLAMVQPGPLRVLGALERAHGGLTPALRTTCLEELGCEEHARTRLELLKGLMKSEGAAGIVHELDAKGCFRPFTAAEAAGVAA